MSEVKRAKLISFEANRVDSANFTRTVRISVILPESTEDNCPEYNYKDELVASKRKTTAKKDDGENKKTAANGLNLFDEEDDNDVKRIAAEMEAKYGENKKRKRKKDDYADIGMGYDESDSFIDNTDGYDEIIPKNVTTLHGGFYINCGALEFKADENLSSNNSSSSEESDDDDDEEEEAAAEKSEKLTAPARVRKLESSTESENETTTNTNNLERKKHLMKKQKLMMSNTTVMQKAIKKRLFSHDKIKQYKRNKTEEYKKTVRELLKERRDDVVVSCSVEDDKKVEPTSVSILKENKKPVVLASVDNVIESVISKTIQNKIEQCHNEIVKTNSEPHSSNEVVINNKVDVGDVKSVEIVQLPQNLPSDIVEIIESIKKAAANSTEGKVKFFTGHVNTMLLNLESKCKCLGKHSRLKVYEHLAPFVKCRKETLIKRAKNLCVIEEQKKIKNLLERLKIIVSQTMPDLVKNYEKETSLVLQKKFSAQGDEASKSLRMPKRQFLWNEEAKKLLRDVMTLQKKCFLLEGKQKELIETHLSDFLKSDVLTIWPEGWMSLNNLLKYCSSILDIKKKIPIVPKKQTTEPPSTASIASIVTTPSNIISANSAVTITPVTTPATPKISVLPDEVLFSKTNINKAPPDVGSAKYVPISNKTEVPDVILIEESPSKEKTIDRDKDIFQIIDLTDPSNRKTLPKPKFYNSPPKQPKPKEPPTSFERPTSHGKEEMNCSSAITQIIADSLRQNTSSNISKSNTLISEHNKKFSNASSSNDYVRTFQNSDGDDIMKVMEDLKVLQKMSSPIKIESTNSSPVSVIAYNKSSSHDPNVTAANQPTPLHRSSSFQDAFQKKFIPDFLKATQNSSATTSTSKQQGNGSNSLYKYNNSTSIKNNERYLQNNTNNNYAQQIYNKLKTQQSVEDSLDLLFGNFLSNDRNHSRTGNSKSNAPHK